MSLDMYAESMIYAYEHPQHKRRMDNADVSFSEENISCGDKLTIYIKLDGRIMREVSFDGLGCVISMGTAEILSDEMQGKPIDEALAFGKNELLKLINIDPGPVRMHCATLSLRALRKALFLHEGIAPDRETKEL